MEIKVESNIKAVKAAEKAAIERALYAMGVKAVEGAVNAISGDYGIDKAVDTGRLRASISFITPEKEAEEKLLQSQTPRTNPSKPVEKNPLKESDRLHGTAEKNTVYVGSNVEYAVSVHEGKNRMIGRPFLREGIDQTKDEMKQQVEMIFKGEL